MESGRFQPWTGSPQDLAGGLGMLLADLCHFPAFITHLRCSFPGAAVAPAFPEDPRSPLLREVSDDVEVGPQLSEGCPVSCAKEGGSCWGYVKHRGCSPAPRAHPERGIHQVLPQPNPLVSPKWALLESPGAGARFLPSLYCHTYQNCWVVMDTGSGWPSGQHPEPQSTKASGSEGTN